MSRQETTDEGFVDFDTQLKELAIEVERLASAGERNAPAAPSVKPAADPGGETPAPHDSILARGALLPLLEDLVRQLERKNKLESTNERLFDTMHRELKSYRDGFLFDALQRPFILDLILLLDQLSPMADTLRSGGGAAIETHAHNLENATHYLLEILHRLGVSELEWADPVPDKRLHRIVHTRPAGSDQESGIILEVLRPGYGWKDRVLRPIEVVVARGSEPVAPAQEPATPPHPPNP